MLLRFRQVRAWKSIDILPCHFFWATLYICDIYLFLLVLDGLVEGLEFFADPFIPVVSCGKLVATPLLGKQLCAALLTLLQSVGYIKEREKLSAFTRMLT